MAEEQKQQAPQQPKQTNEPTGHVGGKISLVLTIFSCVCAVATPLLTLWAQPKATAACKQYEDELYEEYIKAKEDNPEEEWVPLTRGEKIKKGIKYYIPAIATTVVGIGCTIGAHAKDQNTINQVVNYANAVTTGAAIFEKVTQEKVTSQKYDEIRAETNRRLPENTDTSVKVNKNFISTKQLVDSLDEDSRNGKCWFKDPVSGQLWWGSIVDIDKAIIEVNNELMSGDGYCTHAEFMLYAQANGVKGITIEPFFYDLVYVYRQAGDKLTRYVDMAKFDDERGIAYIDLDFNFKPAVRDNKKNSHL